MPLTIGTATPVSTTQPTAETADPKVVIQSPRQAPGGSTLLQSLALLRRTSEQKGGADLDAAAWEPPNTGNPRL
ncbi:hypothetical protein GWC77_14445 [Paraburkholderia sp. NMBU_R16]|uniref:hypothetical protein n=1 Tax=Paraburkholderia sp. NMBU_R16 TaxID=2698676 RepID=UPI001563502D|nr:hypothetical protein [Paraburkholderia sp. NMBU_R16]NRO97123.1 hypothetical protein [Paraburkholderia sp. NMBU_R16]